MPGFRFHPTDIELLNFFLKRKITAKPIPKNTVTELDVYQYPPWDLPIKSALKSDDPCWYFFCRNHTEYRNGSSMVNPATGFGYWKGTGKDREIWHAGKRTVARALPNLPAKTTFNPTISVLIANNSVGPHRPYTFPNAANKKSTFSLDTASTQQEVWMPKLLIAADSTSANCIPRCTNCMVLEGPHSRDGPIALLRVTIYSVVKSVGERLYSSRAEAFNDKHTRNHLHLSGGLARSSNAHSHNSFSHTVTNTCIHNRQIIMSCSSSPPSTLGEVLIANNGYHNATS
ncbi:hypothetical protein Cgig2_022883 [Carnegiea gigantea]|uniref:NAC domain-containing protein n=1 Tax=Carnegiea gigantea TaxID=171969 RepID=A0A9Q1KP66_9CARY|nr:hypothetical protein Cgig2_022883 [Carnegiea gigantea]